MDLEGKVGMSLSSDDIGAWISLQFSIGSENSGFKPKRGKVHVATYCNQGCGTLIINLNTL